jgi:hypothetical protein
MTTKDTLIRSYITTTSGMRGSFAVLVGDFIDENGNKFTEPIITSAFAGTAEDAIKDAKEWAKAEELPFV